MPDQIKPRIFLLRAGGIAVEGDDGERIAVSLTPREMRILGGRLYRQAGQVERPLPSRVGGVVNE